MEPSIAVQTLNETIEVEKHKKFFLFLLKRVNGKLIMFDIARITGIYFCVLSLDILNFVELSERQRIIDFVKSQQFRADPIDFNGHGFRSGQSVPINCEYDCSHLAATYSALCVLLCLGDDLSSLNRAQIINSVKQYRNPDGSFMAAGFGCESDVRFLYCACAISALLNDWSAIDIDASISYIRSCVCHDGGISLNPDQESHGGSTYCALASLSLMNRLNDSDFDELRHNALNWCVHRIRNDDGVQGRINKDPDTCYSFWIGASIRILSFNQVVESFTVNSFIFKCQSRNIGGFSKCIGNPPDPLHSFYSIAWLSLQSHLSGSSSSDQEDHHQLKMIDPRLGLCMDKVPLHVCSL